MKDERKHQNAGKKSQTKYDKNKILADAILWVSHGKTLRDFCRQEGMPSYVTVYGWLKDNEEAQAAFQLARDVGYDVIAEGCMELADEVPERDGITGKIDPGFIAWKKNQIWTRLQLLSKWSNKYSDKVNLNHEGGVTLNVVTGVPDDR